MKTQRNRKQKPATDAKPAETDAAKIEEAANPPPPTAPDATASEQIDRGRGRLGEINADTLLMHRGNGFFPDDLDGVDTNKPDAVASYAAQWASLFCILERRTRDLIAKAIREGDESGITETGDRFINDTLTDVLFVTENSPAKRAIIAAAFKVTTEELQAAYARRMAKIKSAATAENAEQGELFPAVEPTTEEIIEQAATELETLTRGGYGQLVRGISKLDRRYSYFRDTGRGYIGFELAKNQKALILFNPPPTASGDPQRVTPYDQEVEATATNIYNKFGAGSTVSIEQFFRAMNGTDATDNVGKKAASDILESVRKLQQTKFSVKATKGEFTTECEIAKPILDADIITTYKNGTQKRKFYIRINAPGLLSSTDWALNGCQSYDPIDLNISAGYWRRGAIEEGKGEISATQPTGRGWEFVKSSFTPLTITIRKYLLMEIHRIKATPSLAPASNTITYDAVIKYEADPALVVYGADGLPFQDKNNERKIKEAATPAERKAIEKMRATRRAHVLDILGHYQAIGRIKRFYEIRDPHDTRRKHGIVIEVDKTDPTLKKIEATAKRRRIQHRDAKN